MSNYVKATNFATKDTLPSGDSNKIVKGTEIDNEFNAIAGAVSSKSDIASPTFTGVPAAPTATEGSNTTQIANTAYVKTAIDTATNSLGTISTQNANAVNITGGTIVGITDLAVADGGTGRSTLAANAVLVGNGTSGINSVAPSTSGNALRSNGTSWVSGKLGLGLSGEVWNNVTGSRAGSTTYTNSNSYPIMFAVSAQKITDVNAQGVLQMVVNDSVITQVESRVGNNIDHNVVVLSSIVIVPPGQTYRANLGSLVLTRWNELY
jgi:hypothetical protein